MTSLMWHKSHKDGTSEGSSTPRGEASVPPSRKPQGCRTSLPPSRARRKCRSRRGRLDGERRKQGNTRVAESSEPVFTLAAKPLTAYHFIARSAERRSAWRTYNAAPIVKTRRCASRGAWKVRPRGVLHLESLYTVRPLVSSAPHSYLCCDKPLPLPQNRDWR